MLIDLLPDFQFKHCLVSIEGKRGDEYSTPYVEVRFAKFENTGSDNASEAAYDVRIVYIDIDFVYHSNFHNRTPEPDFPEKRYRTSDWELLVSALLALPHLRAVELGFPHPSTPDDLLKAHGSTMEQLLCHDQLTATCWWVERRYDPMEGCMEWFWEEIVVKAKAPEAPDTNVGALFREIAPKYRFAHYCPHRKKNLSIALPLYKTLETTTMQNGLMYAGVAY